jgi:type 1 glutamine amidotransferase
MACCPFFRSTMIVALLTAGLLSVTHSRADDAPKPIRALLVIGGCCHDYAKQKDIITKGVSARANVQWTISYDPDTGTKHLNPVYNSADWAKNFDVIVHDECCSDVKELEIINRILEPHRQGLPAVVLHCGMHCYRSAGYPKKTPWFEFTGLISTGHGPQAPIALTFLDKDSAITNGQSPWTTINEELYNNYAGHLENTAHALVRGKQSFKTKRGAKDSVTETIVAWTNIYKGKTKVFATTLGHNNETVADPRYLDMVTRGLLWSVDKLNEDHLQREKGK